MRPGPHPVKRTSFSAESEALQGLGYAASAEHFKVRHGSLNAWKDMLQRFAKSVYSSFLLQGTQHEQLQTKYHHAQDYHAIGSHYRPCKNWQFSGSMNVTSITSICNFPAPIKSFVSKTPFCELGAQAHETSFRNKALYRSCFQAQVCPASVSSLSCPH